MDVLSDVLDHLRLRGSLYFSTEFTPPWGVRVPCFRRVARFHLVVRGGCWIRSPADGEPVLLEAGDLALVPHGAEHVLSDRPDSPVRTVDEVVELSGFDGRGALVWGGEPGERAPARLVCGHFEFDDRLDHPFLDQLPPILAIRWAEGVQGSPLEELTSFIAHEVRDAHPGRDSLVRRLSEALFIQAIRLWSRDADLEVGILRGVADPRLGAAIEAIHTDPAHPWTLEELGRRAALGRSAFSEHFREVVGETPHQYLTRWRMQIARRLLLEGEQSMQRIARTIGYDSASSFSRAFRQDAGIPPSSFRAQAG